MQSTDSFVDEIYSLIYTKSVESILSLVPRHKGLRIALIVETSNADTTPKPHASVNIQFALSATKRQNRPKPIRLYRIHLMRRFRCFVFDNQLEVAKFLRRQNQSVQLRLFMYTCPPNLCPSGFRHGFRRYKVSTISSKTALFDSPKISLIPDLILLTINMSRSSIFFLVIIVE